MKKTKLLVVGLDAADADLIKQWADEGHLPVFRRLLNDAAHGRVVNPIGLEAGSAWPTFYYGVSPALHGQYDGTRYFEASRYHDGRYPPDRLYSSPIWTVLSEAGKRVALIDAPYHYIAKNLNGIDIHDWGPHAPTGENSFAHFKTSPPELAREIEERFGLDPLKGVMCDTVRPRSLSEQRKFRDDLVERVKRKMLMTQHFMATEDWDFLLTVFGECHCIGHHAWHTHDPSHPDHDPAIAREIGDPILDIYKVTDQSVGEILQQAGPDTTAIVYCSHGMGTRYSGTLLLDKILARLDGFQPHEVSPPLTRMMRKAWRSLPKGLQYTLKPTQAKLYKKIYHDNFQGNRADRRFFEILTNDRTAGIRFNVIGREPNGKVAPGAELDALCRELTDKLMCVVNADTGLPLVKEIHRSAELHRGERSDQLPDLLVTWNRVGAELARVASPDIGEMRHDNLSLRTGDHKPEGLFFAEGPSIVQKGDIGAVNAMDFAPTFAALLGAQLPVTDGTIIPTLVSWSQDETQTDTADATI